MGKVEDTWEYKQLENTNTALRIKLALIQGYIRGLSVCAGCPSGCIKCSEEIKAILSYNL